jgi:hypothetical protein
VGQVDHLLRHRAAQAAARQKFKLEDYHRASVQPAEELVAAAEHDFSLIGRKSALVGSAGELSPVKKNRKGAKNESAASSKSPASDGEWVKSAVYLPQLLGALSASPSKRLASAARALVRVEGLAAELDACISALSATYAGNASVQAPLHLCIFIARCW